MLALKMIAFLQNNATFVHFFTNNLTVDNTKIVYSVEYS